jgi:hypothetical protein
MNRIVKSALLLLPAAMLLAGPAVAQNRVSPRETVKATIGGNEVSITYSRPFTKDPKTGEKRQIWGGLVPHDKVWRLGADEATTLTTQKDIEIGDKAIPAGTYSLFLLPKSTADATLIVNKQTGQWGTKYDEKQDLARIDLKKEASNSAPDQFTITMDSGEYRGMLKIAWQDRLHSAPITLKKQD